MQRIYSGIMPSPLGELRIFCDDTHIIRLMLGEGNGAYGLAFFEKHLGRFALREENEIVRQVKKELEAYFKSGLQKFSTPVRLYGTPLEKSVLEAVRQIPYGQTASYGEIARRAGTLGIRAASSAIGRNPVPIYIPCHRVIHADGSLGGFTGGIWKKILLQQLEGLNP